MKGSGQLRAFHTEFGAKPCLGNLVPRRDEGIHEGRLVAQARQLFRGIIRPDRAVIFGGFGNGGGRNGGPYRVPDGAQRVLLQKIAQGQHFLVQCRTGGQEGDNGLHVFKITLLPQSRYNGWYFAIGVAVGDADQCTERQIGTQFRRHEIIVRPS